MAIGYHPSDAFPELRALAWKRGAEVLPGGVHVHDSIALLAVTRGRDADDARALMAAPPHPDARCYLHGERVFFTLPLLGRDPAPGLETLPEARDLLHAFAAGRAYAAELFFDELSEASFIAAKKQLGASVVTKPRLLMSYWGSEAGKKARELASLLDADGVAVVAAGKTLLVEGAARRKRLAVMGYRHAASVARFDGSALRVQASFWLDQPRPQRGKAAEPRVIDVARLEAALRASLPKEAASTLTLSKNWQGPVIALHTDAPALALTAIAAVARDLGSNFWVGAEEIDPLALALRRLIAATRR